MKVVFACVHNAGRSQMAAAFFNQLADSTKAVAVSAGTQPADKVHDCVLQVMRKSNIDLSNVKPQLLTNDLVRDADLLITMGCGEACPFVAGLRHEDWPLPDPKDKGEDEVCEIRDRVKGRVLSLLKELGALRDIEFSCMLTEDDEKFLQSFEQLSLGATCWTHAAHVRVGWIVLVKSTSFESAIERLRAGIMQFNSTKNTIGYHETITVAFARLIDSRRVRAEDWNSFAQRNGDLFDKKCLEQYYSSATLFSEEAKSSFVEPDLRELPSNTVCSAC